MKPHFVVLVSSDECEFYLDQRVAKLCEYVSNKLATMVDTGKIPRIQLENIKGETLEVVLQYLHFKSKYMNTDFTKSLPPFYIKPELALDVLNASLALQI
eukprot:CAMPEP_0176448114 /NCGR_PEP_ID=MMETSP0127-20121128/25547_1 /TAXON_ID=938130 /ORGANISM="Platyophrya macrostoma, Strain WH" /LENGTH=99 /DNA_ID=CAMNT_0017834915 /DNA_START=43 /DNA_END=342 /DNA_ORIENTATION=+